MARCRSALLILATCLCLSLGRRTNSFDNFLARKKGNVKVPEILPLMLGLNIPWRHYAQDLGTGLYDSTYFNNYFHDAHVNKSNIARFWVHCDGNGGALQYDDAGAVTGVNPTFFTELRDMVDLAADNEIVLQLCLWSFDMCKPRKGYKTIHNNLIYNTKHTQSYINQVLTPMLDILAGAPNVIIEVINEPEWCINDNDGGDCHEASTDCVTAQQMQTFVAKIAHAVHTNLNPAPVTVGSASLKWSSTEWPGQQNYWSNEALREASGISGDTPTLDLYNIHYFEWMHQWEFDPMAHDINYWGLTDKATVVAEMPAIRVNMSVPYTIEDLVYIPYYNGYLGSMFWGYNDPNYPTEAAIEHIESMADYYLGADYATLTMWMRRFRGHGQKG